MSVAGVAHLHAVIKTFKQSLFTVACLTFSMGKMHSKFLLSGIHKGRKETVFSFPGEGLLWSCK